MTSQPATMARPADVGSKVATMRTVVVLAAPLASFSGGQQVPLFRVGEAS